MEKFIEPTNTKKMKTKVIFRKFPKSNGGEVIALFPQIAGTNDASTCLSYMHVGQHSAATVFLSQNCKLATPSEFKFLAKELRRIGYKLKIAKRATRKDFEMRKQQINKP